jgi:hypothetical protein
LNTLSQPPATDQRQRWKVEPTADGWRIVGVSRRYANKRSAARFARKLTRDDARLDAVLDLPSERDS